MVRFWMLGVLCLWNTDDTDLTGVHRFFFSAIIRQIRVIRVPFLFLTFAT